MGLGELMDDLFIDEPISITLRNGVTVRGTVHSRHRALDGQLANTTVLEDAGVASSVMDNDIESVRLEDVEWRRRGQGS